jgi:alpha-L-rhamnosidase
MLALGATTFWEDFNLEWATNAYGIDQLPVEGKDDIHGDFGDYCYVGLRHSLCHGWASGPTAWLSEHVLGIKILEPGCTKVSIIPNLGNLEWAEGTYPTPYGVISVKHRRQSDGSVKSEIKAPREVKIVRN